MASRRSLCIDEILDIIDADTSDFAAGSGDDDDDDIAFVPARIPTDVSSDDDFSSSDDEPLSSFAAPVSKGRPNKSVYCWRKKTYDVPDTSFSGVMDGKVGSPYQYFREFVTDDMLDIVVQNTNLYSVQKKGKSIDISKKELEQVIGMYFRMGIAQMPGVRAYWENDTRYAPVADIMSRNRFQSILSLIHFVDNSTCTDAVKMDKLWKIRPWTYMFRAQCLKITPEEHNSIDEMMIPFKGSFSGIKQYMKGKPHKWGYKIWARAGASGILYDFDIYQGKRGNTSDTSSLGVAADVVLKLSSTLSDNKNYKVYADNFLSSIPLLEALQNHGIHDLGTIRPNRLRNCNLESDADLKKYGRGSYDFRVEQNHNFVAVKWHDTRAVTLVSTYAGPEPTSQVSRWDKRERNHVQVQIPLTVKEYNSFMGGIDLLDCFLAKYKYHMKSRR
ncbi:piggyBac transposable element-derived protein 3-like [Penaeus chinensis]|uniref:piggyBac transposable element-derived protein 3-like n=1 Tax=Penaeus chinensis TaxID=139456 RepID=UPI001FB680F1|nr:piggyBac transposable element-derived protein 3-like [Penaeus chinensis]